MFAQNIKLLLVRTHNLLFRAKIRKNITYLHMKIVIYTTIKIRRTCILLSHVSLMTDYFVRRFERVPTNYLNQPETVLLGTQARISLRYETESTRGISQVLLTRRFQRVPTCFKHK